MEVIELNMSKKPFHQRLLVIATVPSEVPILSIFINYDRSIPPSDIEKAVNDICKNKSEGTLSPTRRLNIERSVSAPARFNDFILKSNIKSYIKAVISSDCLGDLYTLRLPLSIGDDETKRVWLGGYYPFIPSFVKYKINDRLLIGMDEKYRAVTRTILDIISKSNPNNIFLWGEHDPFVFPLSYTLVIRNAHIALQHSLISLEQRRQTIGKYDRMINEWRDREGRVLGSRMFGSEPLFITQTTPMSKVLIPNADLIVVGKYLSYKRLKIKRLFTVNANNSLYMSQLLSVTDNEISNLKREIVELDIGPISWHRANLLLEKKEKLRELETLKEANWRKID